MKTKNLFFFLSLLLVLFFQSAGVLAEVKDLTPVEFPRDPLEQQFVVEQNKRSREFLSTNPTLLEKLKGRAKDLTPQNQPAKTDFYGDEYFIKQNNLFRGVDEVIIPASLIPAGNVLSDFRVSPDKKYVAYGYAAGGTDWQVWHVLEIATGKNTEELFYLRNTGANAPVWGLDSKGFYYCSTSDSAADDFKGIRHPKVFYHVMGSKMQSDLVIFDDHEKSQNKIYQVWPINQNRVIVFRTQGVAEIPFSAYLVDKRNPSENIPMVAPAQDWGRLIGMTSEGEALFRTSEFGPNYGIIKVYSNTCKKRKIIDAQSDFVLIQSQQIGQKLFLQYLDKKIK
jgi:prolyl oligopeptidase